MKIITCLAVIAFMAGCTVTPNKKMNDAAIHVCGVFMADNIHSVNELKIAQGKVERIDSDSIYHATGSVEGFSPLNYPVTIEHFSETVRYLGGDPNDKKNWECIEIYVGKKKMK